MSMSDLPAPTWNQNINDNPGADPATIDPQHATDCGEQSCAMVIYSTRGIEVPEETIRGYIHGNDSGPGNTTAEELAGYLGGPHCNLHAEVDRQPWPHIQESITTQLAQGHLVLVLGTWYSPDFLHWVVAVGFSLGKGGHVLAYHDPWDGTRKQIGWDDYAARVDTGTLVLVKDRAVYA